MARCSGCSGDRCSCVIRNGANTTVTGAGTPTNPYVISAAAGGAGSVPPGAVVMFGGAAVPAGWTMANGSALNRVAFAALFAAIGTTFGAGDGSTTFNVPNLEQRFPVGAQGVGAYALGAVGGAASVTLSVAQLPSHTHTMNHAHTASASTAPDHNHSDGTLETNTVLYDPQQIIPNAANQYAGAPGFNAVAGWVAHSPRVGNIDGATGAAGSHSHTITVDAFNGNTGATGSGTAVPTVPPYLALNFIIKT